MANDPDYITPIENMPSSPEHTAAMAAAKPEHDKVSDERQRHVNRLRSALDDKRRRRESGATRIKADARRKPVDG